MTENLTASSNQNKTSVGRDVLDGAIVGGAVGFVADAVNHTLGNPISSTLDATSFESADLILFGIVAGATVAIAKAVGRVLGFNKA